jgi:hypothetical protein
MIWEFTKPFSTKTGKMVNLVFSSLNMWTDILKPSVRGRNVPKEDDCGRRKEGHDGRFAKEGSLSKFSKSPSQSRGSHESQLPHSTLRSRPISYWSTDQLPPDL